MFARLKRRKLLIFSIVLVVGAGVILIARAKNGSIPVEQVEPITTKVIKSVSATGTVVSENEVNLSFPAIGKVAAVYVKKADFVKKGTMLAQLDSSSAYQSAQSLKDSRDVALRDRDLFIENYETNKDAVGGEDEYEINLRRLDELVSRAEASYQSQLSSLTNFYIYAPFAGTIVSVDAKPGEAITAGITGVRLADLTNLLFEIAVDQEDFGLLKIGLPVEITLDSYEDRVFNGVVSELPLFVEDGTEEFSVKIQFSADSKDGVLLGMDGDADIIIEESGSELPSLSFDQLFSDETGTYVWVMENGLAQKMYVETGLEGDIYTEVTTDLTGFVLIAPTGDQELTAGAKVELTN